MTDDTDRFFVGRCPRCDGEGIIEVEVAWRGSVYDASGDVVGRCD